MTEHSSDEGLEFSDEGEEFFEARWFRTDPSSLIGHEGEIPATLEEVASSGYRHILSQLFREWLISRSHREDLIFKACLNIVDSGAALTSSKALDILNKDSPDDEYIKFSEWDSLVGQVKADWNDFRADLITLLATYKDKRTELQAATALNMFDAYQDDYDDIVKAARQVGEVTTAALQNIDEGIAALLELHRFLRQQGVVKTEYSTSDLFENLSSLVRIAGNQLAGECDKYGRSQRRFEDRATEARLRLAIIEALNEYNKAVLTLAETVTRLARVLEESMAVGAETLAAKNFAESNPQVAAGLFLLQGGGLMLATGLGLAGVFFPPLGIAAGAVGAAAIAAQKTAVAYNSRQSARNPDRIKEIVASKLKGKASEGPMSELLSRADEGFTVLDSANLASDTAQSFGFTVPAVSDALGATGQLLGPALVPVASVVGVANLVREAQKLSGETRGGGRGNGILATVSALASGQPGWKEGSLREEKKIVPGAFQGIVRQSHLEGDTETFAGQMDSLDSIAVAAIQTRDFTQVGKMLDKGVISNIRMTITATISPEQQPKLLENLDRIEAMLRVLASKGEHAEVKGVETGHPDAG